MESNVGLVPDANGDLVGTFLPPRVSQRYASRTLYLMVSESDLRLSVARFVEEIKAEGVVCLTATATARVAEDVCKAFQIDDAGVFRTSPYRPK